MWKPKGKFPYTVVLLRFEASPQLSSLINLRPNNMLKQRLQKIVANTREETSVDLIHDPHFLNIVPCNSFVMLRTNYLLVKSTESERMIKWSFFQILSLQLHKFFQQACSIHVVELRWQHAEQMRASHLQMLPFMKNSI